MKLLLTLEENAQFSDLRLTFTDKDNQLRATVNVIKISVATGQILSICVALS